MDLSEIFDRYENKLKNTLNEVMMSGNNQLVKISALKIIEYNKIFKEAYND